MQFFRGVAALLAGILIIFLSQTGLAYASSTSSSVADLKTCVLDICGSFDGLLNAAGGGAFKQLRPVEVQKLIETDLNEKMNQIMDKDLQVTRMALKLWNNVDQIFSHLSKEQKFLLNLVAFSQIDWSKWKAVTVVEKGTLKVNRLKLAEILPHMEPPFLSWASDVFEIVYNSYDMIVALGYKDVPYDTLLRMLHKTPDEAPSLVEMYLNWIRNRNGLFLNWNMFITDAQMEASQKIADKETIQFYEKRKFVLLVSQYFKMEAFFGLRSSGLLLKNPLAWAQVKKIVESKVAQIQSVMNSPLQLDALRAKMLKTCSENVNASLAAAPSKLLNSRFLDLTKNIKSSAMAVLPKYLSGSELIQAIDDIKKTNFQTSPDNEEVRLYLEQHFAKTLQNGQRRNDSLNSILIPGSDQEALFLLKFLFNLKSNSNNLSSPIFQDFNEACSEIVPPNLHAFTFSNEIVVSWQSVVWPQYGAGIVAHELGHVLWQSVNGVSGLKETQQCTDNQHQIFYDETRSPIGTNSMEDWADIFSISVQKDLRESWPYTANFGCLLIYVDIEKQDFKENALDLTAESKELHSSDMYRLIQQQVGMSSLPPSCLKLNEIKSKPIVSCAK